MKPLFDHYDYLIVGAGLYGATFARQKTDEGKRVLVIDKRPHIAGNAYTYDRSGVTVHAYGAHIFHTDDPAVWEYVNRFGVWHDYIHRPKAFYRGKYYSLPFNMYTFAALWGVSTPEEAQAKIAETRLSVAEPANLEEQALSLVGKDVYETLIKGYTQKQWGRACRDLPASIIKRIPVRFVYDDNYFDDPYQAIPEGGYTAIVARMLEGIEVLTGVDYFDLATDDLADKTVFTGPIDRFFGYKLGRLSYRNVRFETEVIDSPDYQGAAVVNYTDQDVPYTRIIEHKHFAPVDVPFTVISREYSAEWQEGQDPYYPVGDAANSALYRGYCDLAKTRPDVLFAGRLGTYRYMDMDDVVKAAIKESREF